MDYGSSNLSSEDRLFLSVPPSRPAAAIASYTVVGGRIVASSQGHFPLNGQQLMMQLDSLTSAMMDMDVSVEEEMEVYKDKYTVYFINLYDLGRDYTTWTNPTVSWR